jgi:hypothetical protein
VTWLLKLYPPRWRRRYGGELTELVAAQPFSIGAAFDLMAGAIDAWFHPQLAASATPDVKGDAQMIARMMQLKCAGYGPDVTASDKVKGAAVMIGGALVLALLWIWAQWQFGDNVYVMALSPMTFFLPLLLSLRYTSLKGRSARAQTTLIAGFSATLAAFFLLVGWIGTKI